MYVNSYLMSDSNSNRTNCSGRQYTTPQCNNCMHTSQPLHDMPYTSKWQVLSP
jgi:hypothetical protein